MTYNKNIKKYIKQCKYLFASYGKSEKEYIRKLIDNIDDGSHNMTYDEVVVFIIPPFFYFYYMNPENL